MERVQKAPQHAERDLTANGVHRLSNSAQVFTTRQRLSQGHEGSQNKAGVRNDAHSLAQA